MDFFCWVLARVQSVLVRANEVCTCDFSFSWFFFAGAVYIFFPIFGHEFWPNYTGLQWLVSARVMETRVYIGFNLKTLNFFICFQERRTLFHIGVKGLWGLFPVCCVLD